MRQGRTETGRTKKYSGVADTVKKSAEKKVIQEPLPRISYDRIKRIYDEYGFSTPDVLHVQENLPNDEGSLRKILQNHRNVMDEDVKAKTSKKISDIQYKTEVYKQQQKNQLAMMKQQARLATQGGMAHTAGGATGGPGFQMPAQVPTTPQPQESGESAMPPGMSPNQQPLDISNAGDAFFVGDFALVKLVNPGVQGDKSPIWLIDVKNKVLRPFMSQRAFDSYFGSSQDAYDAIVVLPSSAVSEGGPLGEFKMMNSEFGIKDDGKMRKLDHSPAMIQRRYGKPVDEAAENKSVLAIDGLFKKLKNGSNQTPTMASGGGEVPPMDATGGPGYEYDGTGGPGVPTLNVSRSLEPGMSGADVKSLQDWLKAQGFLNIGTTTEYYGDMTKAAVAAWQKSVGLDAGQYPGYFGPRSLSMAQSSSQQTSQQTTTSQQPQTQNAKEQSWHLSSWNSSGNQWTQQPTLTIDGRDYKFSTPQEYINAMQGLPDSNGNLQTFIGQFQSVVPHFSNTQQNTQNTQQPTSTTQNNQTSTGVTDTRAQKISALMSVGIDSTNAASIIDNFPNASIADLKTLSADKITSSGMPLTDPTGAASSTQGAATNTPQQWSQSEDYRKAGDTVRTAYSAQSNGNDYSSIKNSFTTSFANALDNSNSLTNLSSSTIESVKQDPSLLAFYINALTYGGYSLGEVFKDMKRRELIASGKTEYEDKLVISGEKTREDWANTDEGRLSNTLPEFNAMKLNLGNVDPSIFNLPLYDVPDELFKKLIPILDPSTPEYKAEIEKIQTIMHDTQVAIINAKTEQAKAVAENEYEKFKESINKTYGITLSNNAIEAWKQIESLGTSAAQSGIYGSGIHNESVDDSLESRRLTGERARDEKMTKEEERMAAHYTKYASPEEIKKLIDEDTAKGLPRDQWRATKWGLVPSQDVLNSMDFATLKQKFPDLTDEEINNKRNNVLDEFGNYRSALYQNKATSMEEERVSHKNDQEKLYTERNLLAEEKRARELTSGSPFAGANTSGTSTTQSSQATQNQSSSSSQSQQPSSSTYGNNQQLPESVSAPIQSAIANIQNSINGLKSQSTSTPAQTQTTQTQPSATTQKTYNSLYDYYSANGGWNTWDSAQRMSDAQKAGITNYTGTAAQNDILLKKLRGY